MPLNGAWSGVFPTSVGDVELSFELHSVRRVPLNKPEIVTSITVSPQNL